ncbi:MAG TPA: hypothetical protein VNK49_04990 [Anaerolineales bacterium]|nr:hypothetical protein [Anaerolineales bacterium]
MRRVFVLWVMAVWVSVLWLGVGKASAAGTITYVDSQFVQGKGVSFVFEATGFRNKNLKGATIFVGSNFYDLFCTVNKEKTLIVCVAREPLTQYAGQVGVIRLAGHTFQVIVPNKFDKPVDESFTCPSGSMLGAWVTFEGYGESVAIFFDGNTLEEIEEEAQEWEIELGNILEIGPLECEEVPL